MTAALRHVNSEDVPQWLVRNASAYPVAIVLSRTEQEARAVVQAGPKWTTRRVGLDRVVGYARPIVVVQFPVLKVPNGAMRSADTAEQGGTAMRVLAAAASVFGLTASQARYARDPQAAKAKTATWLVLVTVAGFSRAGAGRAIGHHHSTVLYALRRAEEYRAAGDAMFAAAVDAATAAAPAAPSC